MVTRRAYLGSLAHHAVFEAELTGIWLALRVIMEQPEVNEAVVCLDNQPAITRSHDPKPKSGQLITDAIHAELEAIRARRPGFLLRLVWLPGQEGVDGNELADLHAKKAAAGIDSAPLVLNGRRLPRSAAALRAKFNTSSRAAWQRR
ncbi:hypothetical protein AURDEDRAFT_76826, partial [Auricularia subglabra TFB-10046 SS5]